ncbi:MAG TPA: sulfatase [Gemmataceae bacterium]|nr:sulfatase [Gemmataceae bacterium]
MRSLIALLAIAILPLMGHAQPAANEKPNIIFIFADDLGYADVGCYGAKGFKTPNLDRMAKEGTRFTSFYTACSVCSGSRAALLTGRHYQRVGVPPVMFPGNKNGLNPNEVTIASILRRLGYFTAIIGKWHLGHLTRYLPTNRGFDYYYGIPYSNDMAIDPVNAKFARDIVFREGKDADKVRSEKAVNNKVPLMRGEEVIEYPVDQTTLTKRYTAETIRLIKENKDKPFFLYVPHAMPHVPLHVSPDFKGRTKTLFGDVMEELDWSVGEILKAVKEAGIEKKTLVIFTSDNGAHQGSAGVLRGKKATMYEGGFRVPCIARWPGKIPADVVNDEVAATVDVLPTFAKLAGGSAPDDRPIDGKDIRPLLFGDKDAKSPHEYYLFPHLNGALRAGDWKFYPWPEGADKKKAKTDPPKKGVQLYNLAKDIGETKNVAADNPQVVERLQAAYQRMTEDLKKNKLPMEKAKDKK